ncbi:MAG: 2,3-bisphosphoglycerate-independent phosphoglycerate mutase [Bacilli bacterium]|nr:2,3-bisphosphoglycerate-independent phosphoglycerate mutase [Bacilli bacterium]
MSQKNLVMLAILDGFGKNPKHYGNAVYHAKKPNLDYLFSEYPTVSLKTSGEAVGLPEGQMGNSEVGHLNIGAGRIVYQSLTRVNIAAKEDTLADMPAIHTVFEHALKNNSALHVMGLLSDGGVHSHQDHIFYLINKAQSYGIKEVFVHAFLDGRDVLPKSALTYLDELQKHLEPGIKLGVVSGRYYAMDRDKNYARTQKAYDALVFGKAPVKDYRTGILDSYEAGITDEFVVPFIVSEGAVIKEHDSVIFANFRPDRAIQISLGLTNPSETKLDNTVNFTDLCFVCMMLYSEKVKGLINFDLQTLDNLYGDVIAKLGLKQLRIAETEKYAHVTYFFDGGVDKEIEGATRILVPSPKVATYDLLPEMSAPEVTKRVLEAIKSEEYDTIILNFANCDMVGHTTVFDAVVKAVETVDKCIGEIHQAVEQVGGTLIITADHGNAEQVFDEEGNLYSSHTTFDVPFCVANKNVELREVGILADIAPTMLELLGIEQPKEMTGKSMIKGWKK